MPEYLAPGVYVEETSYRSKSIEGVATSTAGFVGQARFGPIKGLPLLVTSFEEFQRHFGGLEDLFADGQSVNHLAHGVRLFFENGGKRVYVARIYKSPAAGSATINADGIARSQSLAPNGVSCEFRARFPGRAGNLNVRVRGTRSANLLVTSPGASARLTGVRSGDVVEVDLTTNGKGKGRVVAAAGNDSVNESNLYSVEVNNQGKSILVQGNSRKDASDPSFFAIQKITLDISVEANLDGSTGPRQDLIQRLSTHPDSDAFIARVLRLEDAAAGIEPPADRSQRMCFLASGAIPIPGVEDSSEDKSKFAHSLLVALTTDLSLSASSSGLPPLMPPFLLSGGSDGQQPSSTEFAGSGSGHDASGLEALAAIDDVAIVAAPGGAALGSEDERQAVANALISHCQNLRYRFAIIAGPKEADQASIREFRSKFDSTYAALYYPWLVVPVPGAARETIQLSPEGAVAGIYARSDIERGVHKAPANEVVRGVLRFSRDVTTGEQDVLNPEGIDCLRFFEGRGYRVWGARTITSDPEWTYVNVRRLFIYLEHSIDRSTQWAVFEPNNEELWLKIRLTIESFLYTVWRTGALMGTKPEDAYFVRCDRSTMSQADLDNGRLICLIGVAPTKPAEFVIFRIGQWTAEASLA